jgi:hypothetical protein
VPCIICRQTSEPIYVGQTLRSVMRRHKPDKPVAPEIQLLQLALALYFSADADAYAQQFQEILALATI